MPATRKAPDHGQLARTADLVAATRSDDELIGQPATPALISTLTTERTPMRAVSCLPAPAGPGWRTSKDPTPGPHDVIVGVDSCGVCGTDLHIVAGDYPAATLPLTPGHEIAGTIVATGFPGVSTGAGSLRRRRPSSGLRLLQ